MESQASSFKTRSKSLGRGTLVIVGLVALIAISTGLSWAHYNGYYGSRKIGLETEYLGVRLSAPRADVLFVLGKPAEEKVEDGETKWFYQVQGSTVCVLFSKQEQVRAVWAILDGELNKPIPELKWIKYSVTPAELTARLGEPENISFKDEGLIRYYEYHHHNLIVTFERSKVKAIAVRDFSDKRLGVN